MADMGVAGKVRPVVVVSRRDDDAARNVVIVVPLTTTIKGGDYEVAIQKPRLLHWQCVTNVQGIAAISGHVLMRKLGVLSPGELEKLRQALRYLLEL
jgi:mRNA interferase MazF